MNLLGKARKAHAGCMLAAALVFLFTAAPAPATPDTGLVLVGDREARVAVVLPAEPDELERLAADELVEHVRLISGVLLPLAEGAAPPGLLPVRLGAAAPEELARQAREKGDNPSSFALVVAGDGVSIRGVSPEGTLFGVYELLEQLGVRWYLPGELGRVVPRALTVRAEIQAITRAPSLGLRLFQSLEQATWSRRQRLGGRLRAVGTQGIPPFTSRAAAARLFESNPEYFALVGGERRPRQLCVSNGQLLAFVLETVRARLENDPYLEYLGMGPGDGGGFCECASCRALDGDTWDPVCSTFSVAGRYIWFFNQLIGELEKEYPQLHIVARIGYSRHMFPPGDMSLHPRVVPVLAPITLERIRGMDNPLSPDRHVFRHVIDAWARLGSDKIDHKGYLNNLACPQFPISQVDRVRSEIPGLRESGVDVIRLEVIRQSWAGNAVTPWLAARLMWDVDADVDVLLAEFYDKFYGPAAGPMGQYWEAINAAFRDTPYFTGSSHVYFPIFQDHSRRRRLRSMLHEARRRAARYRGPEPYAQRVRIARLAFDRLELFLDMTAARNRHDYEAARGLMQEFYELTDAMVDRVLEGEGRRAQRLLHWNERSANAGSYFNRFYEQPVSAGYHRTVEAGELVAGLPDEWDFLLDPVGIGELGGWQRPGTLGGNWQRLKTTGRTWSDQGLHYYKGAAWYRTEAGIPERFRGRRIYLWLGGVDNVATVWVNGRYLGTSTEPGEGLPGVPGSFRPFDVEATAALKIGREEINTVTIRVLNDRLAELGTGGITGPVMFWSPHDPHWRP